MYRRIISWLKYRKDRKWASDRAASLAVGLVLSGALTGKKFPHKEAGHVADNSGGKRLYYYGIGRMGSC